MMSRFIGWLLGIDRVNAVDRVSVELGAPWTTSGSGSFWFCLTSIMLVAAAYYFYLRHQPAAGRRSRGLLAAIRAILLLVLLVTLAEPVLRTTVTRDELPEVFLVLDSTASMLWRDRYDELQQSALSEATGLPAPDSSGELLPSRHELVRAWLTHNLQSDRREGLLAQLSAGTKCRLRVFAFEGQTDSHLRELGAGDSGTPTVAWDKVSQQFSAGGKVTALGSVLRSLARQPRREQLAGVLLVSDFNQNAGEPPLGNSDPTHSPLTALGVPVYTIGVGAVRSRDLAVQVLAEPRIRRGENVQVVVRLQQTQLEGESVTVRLQVQTPGPDDAQTRATTTIATREVVLEQEFTRLEIPFFPDRSGELELRAEVTPAGGESDTDNNVSSARMQVVDDYIRLFYVAYEPTWEWRFVKEVFHRDAAVSLRGFRTYLTSSDPRVRETNPLFVPTLTPARAEFFATDVLLLDDVPQSVLTPRFCELVEQYVRELGGGLVVLAGPRFGPRQLLNTPLAKMLPILIDPQGELRDEREFPLERTSFAAEFPFMQLDDDPQLNERGWSRLAHVPWYQPVANVHERAVVLAQHPTDMCLDNKTPQPLLAIRRYGAGEVVYVGFNEMWRLRRGSGERYYQRFWLPLIDRLAMSHPLGDQKRFVVRLDQPQYHVADEAVVSVQAYDADYQPLAADAPEGAALSAELWQAGDDGAQVGSKSVRLEAVRPGVFEARLPLLAAGTFRLRVQDPITQADTEQQFVVLDSSVEMEASVRDEQLQRRLAELSRGASCGIAEADTLLEQMTLQPQATQQQYTLVLWKSPFWFVLIVSLMLSEWLLRKWNHLT